MTVTLRAGFVPLVDAAPLLIAHELGFAAEEELDLVLHPAPSWSALRDMLALEQVEAAHMLSPMPVAMALGLGGISTRIDALSVLSVNGNTIGIAPRLAEGMRAAGYRFDFDDARAARTTLLELGRRLRIGVPFVFSMHAELVHHWLGGMNGSGSAALDVRTVPPPMMAQAIEAGKIDAFCVGEPWGSVAVEAEAAALLLPGRAIWRFFPEKVLAARRDWIEAEPDLAGRLIRAVWRAGRWLASRDSAVLAPEILARHLGVSSEIIERALSGRLVIDPCGAQRHVSGFMEFHDHAATFPWRSHAALLGAQLGARAGLDPRAAATTASAVFRSDLYRQHMAGCGADLPSASSKVEGAVREATAVASQSGRVILTPDGFFDDYVFDPDAPD